MKKIKYLLFLLVAFIPIYVKAYDIGNYYIDAKIEENGDLLVQEYFELNGTYNGYEATIDYKNDKTYDFDPNLSSYGGSKIHNGDSVEVLEVRAVSIDPNFNFSEVSGDIFKQTYSASKGDYGVYELSNTANGKKILIYNPSNYNRAFYLKYRIKNIAIKHNDIAEIGWNIIGAQFKESVEKLNVYVHLPNNTNELRTWAHGPLNGEVSIIDKENIFVTISGLNSYKAIDLRATFDLNVINKSNKTTNVSAIEKILAYEEDMAEQANYERLQQEKIRQQKALNYLIEFENNITRQNYINAREYISYLYNSDIKNEYIQRLNIAKQKLDEIEENKAIEYLEYSKKDPSYQNYEKCKELINIIDNKEVKNNLLNELSIIEEIIKQNEYNQEKKNYIYGILILSINIVLGYISFQKFRKQPKYSFDNKYFRDIPNDYSPEIVSYLFDKKITNNALSAGILNLIRKKIVTAEKINKKNYELKLKEEYKNEINEIEQQLIYLIFGNSLSIETKNFKKNAQENYDAFINRWNSYHKTAIKEAKKEDFYEYEKKEIKKKKKENIFSFEVLTYLFIFSCIIPPLFIFLIIYILYKIIKYNYLMIKEKIKEGNFKINNTKPLFTISFIIICIICINNFAKILIEHKYYASSSLIYILSVILTFIFISITNSKKKKTIKGIKAYKEWRAFKNYLNDFGSFKEKEVIEVSLWEQYLVYATLFGCSKKILKVIKLEYVNDPSYFDTYSNLYITNRIITNSIKKSYNYANSAKTAAQASSSSSGGYSSRGGSFSSGSGRGGGFSSGGGSFGGGRGGGRF